MCFPGADNKHVGNLDTLQTFRKMWWRVKIMLWGETARTTIAQG